MKKILCAILCCALSVLSMTVLVTAEADGETTATPNGAGPLAITEICASPDDAAYEFVEVVNITNSDVQLGDYYMTRWGFSNGSGKWEGLGTDYLFSAETGLNNALYTKLSMADVNLTVGKDDVAVIWIVSAADKAKTVDDFKLYWQSKGQDMSNVKIARLAAYNDSGDISPATVIHKNAGAGFLPDAYAGYAIALTKASKLDEKLGGTALKDLEATANNVNAPGFTSAQKKALHEAADTIAVVFVQTAAETVSHNYFGFASKSDYLAATSNTNKYLGSGKSVKAETAYDGLVWGAVEDGEYPVAVYWDMKTGFDLSTVTDGRLFVNEGDETFASPGVLINGQFGRDGFIPATDAAGGMTSTVRVPYRGK